MNEFQAILIEIIFFVARFAIPAAIIILSAIVLNHFYSRDADGQNEPVIKKG